jgi:hypothetical protein
MTLECDRCGTVTEDTALEGHGCHAYRRDGSGRCPGYFYPVAERESWDWGGSDWMLATKGDLRRLAKWLSKS